MFGIGGNPFSSCLKSYEDNSAKSQSNPPESLPKSVPAPVKNSESKAEPYEGSTAQKIYEFFKDKHRV